MLVIPQEPSFTEQGFQTPNMNGERVVISGMAGLYPQSRHVKDLANILYNKENPITSDALRYEYKHPEVADFSGSIPDLDRFDAQFFKVHYRLSNSMDPMSRKMLEQTCQAIYDAGVNPEQLSGRKVGVFIGSCFSETEKTSFYDLKTRTGFGIAGCSKAMFANRISYWLNAKGPSMSIDEGCCSSAAALEQAFLAMSRGDCEAAVVGGAFICLHPQSSVHYGRTIKLCMDGKTRAFAENADGCAKSEAVNVLFLQKAKDAVRIYADVIHTKAEFVGLIDGESGYGFFRKPEATASFLKKFYEEAKVSSHAVEYVEAFGSALLEVDKVELQTIDEVFCKDRDDPLLVGSVMSNIGYNEAATGISAVTKVLLGYHFGELSANLHCEQPRQDVAALREGRVRLLTERRRFGRGYVAINGMSVTGVNSHILLHGHYRPKDLSRYKSNIPRLVTISARQESGVTKIIEDLKSRPIDAEELALLHNIHQYNISGHMGRGFVVLDTDSEKKTVSISEKAAYFDDARRPLWFVYSGMGSQWPGMGAQLMRIPIFASAIERCHKALQRKGINIVDIITSPDKNMFDNILHSFVGIAAVQIGLTDILNSLGLVPDRIIGHSVGELGCAYADGCFTAEEMILSAYCRGLVSLQTPFIRGSMAAVGMGYAQIVKICPPEIEVACHNGPESSTISGPAEAMRTFVAELTAKGVFAKEVPCSNIAYHSRYIADAGPVLLKYLKEVIKTPRARSSKWISSSVPEDKWDTTIAKFSSAEYHTNNLLNSVLFEETSRLIPSNAVLVEVAPHGLLQAILKRSLSPDCVNIPLTRRNHADNACMLLDSIGKLYMEGYKPKIQNLYPKVEFPVSTGTPLLSHFVEWAHGEKWPIPYYCTARRVTAASCKFIISLFDTEHKYLRGNVIRGKILYPFAAALVAVWDTLAMVRGVPKKEVSVEFNDVHLYSQPILHDRRQLCLNVAVHRGSGSFEITDDNNSKVATGFVNLEKKQTFMLLKRYERVLEPTSGRTLTGNDIYQLFEDRDYSYSDRFRSIQSASACLSEGLLSWDNNWVTIIDGMLQLNVLRQPYNSASTPTHIRRLGIDIGEYRRLEKTAQQRNRIEYFAAFDVTRCNGIFIENVQFKNMPVTKDHKIALDMLKFIPNFMTEINALSSLQVYAQILAENMSKETINILGITDNVAEKSVFEYMKNILMHQIPGVTLNYKHKSLIDCHQYLMETDAIIVQNLSTDDSLSELLLQILPNDKFLISEEHPSNKRIKVSKRYRVLSSHNIIKETDGTQSRFDLVYWRPSHNDIITKIITLGTIDRAALFHISAIRENLASGQKLIVFAQYPSPPELKKLVTCWRKENERNSIYLYLADDVQYAKKRFNDIAFAFTIMKNGIQGGEYYVPEMEPKMGCSNITLISKQIGDYNSLAWIETPEPVLPTGIMVQVQYAGITNTDFKKAIGVIQLKNESENSYGMDFSGITKSGERVMGMLPKGACSKQIRVIPQLLWPVPEHWSLEDAATVPSAYIHAMYLLIYKGRIEPGNNVLIHGGAGALGQAAIAVALAHDCNVFTTVSDVRKKRFLRRLFPSFKDEHIGNSRDSSFSDSVLIATSGKGCDLIISSIKGELKNNNYKCCAIAGTVVDASQLQDHENFSYGMSSMLKDRSYIISDFSSVLSEGGKDLKQLQLMLSEGIARGFVRPLTRVTYAAHDAARAFRLLAASAHRGRVLLAMRDAAVPALPRIFCNVDSSHLILCGEDTIIGLHLAERLIGCGTRKLHLHFKSEISGAMHLKIQTWRTQSVKVEVTYGNLDTEEKRNFLLNNAMGPVEGIYITSSDVHSEAISTLDTLSREFCPNLKYFAVISSSDHFGKNTCLSRQQDGLPATMISLPKPDDKLWALRNAWCDFAVEAIERALTCSEAVVLARPLQAPKYSLLQQLALVAGGTFNSQLSNDTKLQEMGLADDKMESISNYLANHYNISYDTSQVAQLTIKQVSNLETVLTPSEFERVSGLAKFISYVDADELLATTDVVILPTLITGEFKRDDEFDTSNTYLCIVPGLEGNHERFRVLCRRLKLPALVLQTGLDKNHKTLRETAERYAQVLLKKAGVKETFYLMGYENGTDMALEIAGVMEDYGLTGTVFCVGCAPAEFQTILEDELQDFKTEELLQEAVLRHIFKLIVGDDTTALDVTLMNTDTWENKLESCIRILLRRAPGVCSAQYARELIESVLARIKQVRENRVTVRALRSQVVLLQAASKTSIDVSDLQHYSQQPVAVHQLAAPLEHATSDLRCAAIINQSLHREILENYDKKNICETYLLNNDSFMTVMEE